MFSKKKTQPSRTAHLMEGIIQGEEHAKSIIRREWLILREELARAWIPQDARDAMTEIDRYLEE